MKKSAVLCLLFVVFSLLAVSMLVYAQDVAVNSSNVGRDTLNQTVAEVSGSLKQGVANLTGNLNDRTDDLLDKEVVIPSWLEMPAKILFGIEQGVSWQKLIILLGVWIAMFILFYNMLSLFSLFRNITILLISFGFTIFLVWFGLVNILVDFFVDYLIYLALLIVVLVVIGSAIRIILKKRIVSLANEKGKTFGAVLNASEKLGEGFKKVNEYSG